MSYLIVSGWNYRTSPIAIRERFSVSATCQARALDSLNRMPHIEESVILSTCNRTEVYAVVSDVQAGFSEIDKFFASAQADRNGQILRPNFKLMHEDVVVHLFRVACGLDSLIFGDAQILSQLRQAGQAAHKEGSLGATLKQLFHAAQSCGKSVRSQTPIGRLAASVSSAAVQFGRSRLGRLHDKNVLVVGAGRMAQMCLKLLSSECANGRVVSVNRSKGRLSAFPPDDLPEFLNTNFEFEDRHRLVASSDLVIVAASSPDYLLDRDTLAKVLPGGGKRVCIIDISVPRNVDPRIAELKDARLFHADDLANAFPDFGERAVLIEEAEKIIFEKLDEFKCWQRSLSLVPTMLALRQKFESIGCEQLAKVRLTSTVTQESFYIPEVKKLSRAIVNHLLHEPTVRLKEPAEPQIYYQQAAAIRSLFGI